jgi:hypothetical protein
LKLRPAYSGAWSKKCRDAGSPLCPKFKTERLRRAELDHLHERIAGDADARSRVAVTTVVWSAGGEFGAHVDSDAPRSSHE